MHSHASLSVRERFAVIRVLSPAASRFTCFFSSHEMGHGEAYDADESTMNNCRLYNLDLNDPTPNICKKDEAYALKTIAVPTYRARMLHN